MIAPVNATGWALLYDGHLLQAAFTLYNISTAGWGVAILFLVYQFMLYIKTRNLPLLFTTGLIFTAMFATATFVKQSTLSIMFLMLALEFAGILYLAFWK